MSVNNSFRSYPVGIDYNYAADLKSCVLLPSEINETYGFNSFCIPITHPLFKRELVGGPCLNKYGPFTRTDIILFGNEWQMVVGKVSPYIDCDSNNNNLRKSSELTFLQELSFAAHLNIPAVMFSLNRPNNINLARLLHSQFTEFSSQQFWVRIPLQCPSAAASSYRKNVNIEEMTELDTWHWWNQFRLLTNSEKYLGVALELGPDLPSQDVLSRWLGEPVWCALIPTAIFLTNKKGYPVLTRPHQTFVSDLIRNNCKIYITGSIKPTSLVHYRKYIEHLVWKSNSPDALAEYAQGYEDFLQYPLQPLSDNLESQTYEIFETDPVKYRYYQEAIYHALLDRVKPEDIESNVQIVMIVGAGRGPLVNATLNASKNSDVKVKIYAVEKNPNAVITLYAQKDEIWGDKVTIIASDMRDFHPPDKADILVSELLGSFGDNELSPECLDGAQKVLKDDGISIPCSYTSYLTPLHSMKLFTELKKFIDPNKEPFAFFEMPYVVHQKNCYHGSNVQKLFTFSHPNRAETIDNSRYKTLKFKMKTDCVLHGFSGYFSTVLYDNIVLNIVPSMHTPGMFSWFPIYFPIKDPITLKENDTLVVHFWRCCNSKSIWYEWCVSEPIPLSIHNVNGRSYSIPLH